MSTAREDGGSKQQQKKGGGATRRLEDADVAEEPNPKRARSTVSSLLHGLKCPITDKLLLHPVMAEDNHMYEKDAFEELVAETETVSGPNSRRKKFIRSPVTQEAIDSTFKPAPSSVQKTIESLVANFEDTDDCTQKEELEALIADWKDRKSRDSTTDKRDKLLQKAHAGDIQGMLEVGNSYERGINGFAKNIEKAYFWCRTAADEGSLKGMAMAGSILLTGKENPTTADAVLGCSLLTMAAFKDGGSSTACIRLGTYFAGGLRDFGKDREHAKDLLFRGLSEECSELDARPEAKEIAWEVLGELLQEEEEGYDGTTGLDKEEGQEKEGDDEDENLGNTSSKQRKRRRKGSSTKAKKRNKMKMDDSTRTDCSGSPSQKDCGLGWERYDPKKHAGLYAALPQWTFTHDDLFGVNTFDHTWKEDGGYTEKQKQKKKSKSKKKRKSKKKKEKATVKTQRAVEETDGGNDRKDRLPKSRG